MARWRCRAQKRSDSGVSAIEYGLLLAAIAAAIFLTVMFGFRQTVVDALTGFTDSFSQLVNGGAGGGAAVAVVASGVAAGAAIRARRRR